jgi:hypothetical protein
LSDYPEIDFIRIISVLKWLVDNPDSGFYPRQLPIAGLDTKWLEKHQKIITSLAAYLLGRSDLDRDFYQICSLKKRPNMVRLKVLDPQLRKHFGGLNYILTPLSQLAELQIEPRVIMIIENLETGLAFEDLPETIVIFGHGNDLQFLSEIPWILSAGEHYYWGDIDLAGLAMLSRARKIIPSLQSFLMDESTLLAHIKLWGKDDSKATNETLCLNDEELNLFTALNENRFGDKVRFEQERIAWDLAWKVIQKLVVPDQPQ